MLHAGFSAEEERLARHAQKGGGRHARTAAPPGRPGRRKRGPRRLFAAFAAVVLAACIGLPVYLVWAAPITPNYSWYTAHAGDSELTINGEADLAGLAQLVNGTADTDNDGQAEPAIDFAGKTVKLANNLNFGGRDLIPIGGEGAACFAGTFDGQGHTIDNFVISLAQRATDTSRNIGIFGAAGPDSHIVDVTVGTGASFTLALGTQEAQAIQNVGLLVGKSEGSVTGCTNRGSLTLSHAIDQQPGLLFPIRDVGGLAGVVLGDLSDCANFGTITVTESGTPYQPAADEDFLEQSIIVVDVGGVVGSAGATDTSIDQGSLNTHGSISGCANFGRVVVDTPATNGLDRFGNTVYSQASNIGGIAGYARGSVEACTNSGYVRAANGLATGGIVGNVRAKISVSGYNPNFSGEGVDDGMSVATGDPLGITDCVNSGLVYGRAQVGGIVGRTGSYVDTSGCLNAPSAYVVATRATKPMPAGIVGGSYGTVSYCANLGTVVAGRWADNSWIEANWSNEAIRNQIGVVTSDGYYASGIAGVIQYFTAVNDEGESVRVTPLPEVYGCYNAGRIMAIDNMRQRNIVGDSGGYVHDNIAVKGMCFLDAIVFGENPEDADSAGGTQERNYVVEAAPLKANEAVINEGSTTPIAVLNRFGDRDGWSHYWTLADASVNSGYPALNNQVAGNLNIADASVAFKANAPYTGLASVPQAEVSLDGTSLVQNIDFIVVPQTEPSPAIEVTAADEKPYTASVQGIGRYVGTASQTFAYGIDKGNLADCTALVDAKTFKWDPQFLNASEISVTNAAGALIDPAEYTFAFDPQEPKLTDDGNGNWGAANAGSYAVLVSAVDDSTHFSGSVQATLAVKQAKIIYNADPATRAQNAYPVGTAYLGASYDWQSLTVDANVADEALVLVAEYTGHPVKPEVTLVEYLGRPLVEGRDYRVAYGDALLEGAAVPEGQENLGVPGTTGYGYLMVRYIPYGNFSNYDVMKFLIADTPATNDIAHAVIKDMNGNTIDQDYEVIFEEGSVYTPLVVWFGGSPLTEGVDYSISYSANAEVGTASYTISGIGANFSGTLQGSFKIVEGAPYELFYDFDEASLEARVTGVAYHGLNATFDLVIPASVSHDGNDYAVTAIADKAFGGTGYTDFTGSDANASKTKIASAYIPATVRSLGNYAFGSVSSEYTMANLRSVVFAPYSQLESIGMSAFEKAGITQISIPRNVAIIGNRAFRDAASLTEVTFGSISANMPVISTNGINNSFYNVRNVSASGYETATAAKAFVTSTMGANGWEWVSLGMPLIHTVTFDARGGTPEPSPQQVLAGELAGQPSPVPTKEGASFLGWFASTDGGATLAEDPFAFGTEAVTADITLYAKWETSYDDTQAVPALDDNGYYRIANLGHLAWFADEVNAATAANGRAAINGVLVADIDASGAGSGLVPIGTSAAGKQYVGRFDGNGHTVALGMTGATYRGLFGYIGAGGSVKGLTVAGSVAGTGSYTGAVAAYLGGGTIEGCTSTATVSGTTYAGGIVGYVSNGTVTGCSSSAAAAVAGTYNIGGIAGYVNNASLVQSCVNAGTVTSSTFNATGGTGGVVGYATNTTRLLGLANSGSGRGIGNIGGIVGFMAETAQVIGAVNSGSVSVDAPSANAHSVGGVIGYYGSSASSAQLVNSAPVTVPSQAPAKVSAKLVGVGGVVGTFRYTAYRYAFGTIKESSNTGAISSGAVNVGGVIGAMDTYSGTSSELVWAGTLTDCYNRGTVENSSADPQAAVGGVIGRFPDAVPSVVRNNYSTGAVALTGTTTSTQAGGVIGSWGDAVSGIINSELGSVSNNYYLAGSVPSDAAALPLSNDALIKALDGDALKGSAPLLGAAWAADAPAPTGVNDGYPVLRYAALPQGASLVAAAPPRLSYYARESLDLSAFAPRVDFGDGGQDAAPSTVVPSDVVSNIANGYALTAADDGRELSFTVRYAGLTAVFSYQLAVAEDEVDSISVTKQPTRAAYAVGESFDPTGMTVLATYKSGKTASFSATQLIAPAFTIAPTSFSGGEQDVTLTYTYTGTAGLKTTTAALELPVAVLSSVPVTDDEGFFLIQTAAELKWVSEKVNSGSQRDIKVRLTADIDMSGTGYVGIGSSTAPFIGSFDGAGHTVSLAMVGMVTSNNGLVAYLGAGGQVRNVTVEGALTTTGAYAGGVVGRAVGTAAAPALIDNCVNKADITVTNSSYAGGIVGSAEYASVTNCTNFGAVNCAGGVVGGIAGAASLNNDSLVLYNLVNHGAVSTAAWDAGGVIGSLTENRSPARAQTTARLVNDGPVTASLDVTLSYSTRGTGGIVGSLIAGSASAAPAYLSDCINRGAVSGGTFGVGGIVGSTNYSASIVNSYNLGSVTSTQSSANLNVGGIVGGAAYNGYTVTIQAAYNSGSVTAARGVAERMGGIYGGVLSTSAGVMYTPTVVLAGNLFLDGSVTGGGNSFADGEANALDAAALQAAAPLLGPAFKAQDAGYPLLVWEDAPTVSKALVTFNTMGGTAVASQQVTLGEAATAPVAPTRAGHSFDGWFTSADSGATLADDAFDFTSPITGDLTLYAKWTELPPAVFTVTFDSAGGSAVPYQMVDEGACAVLPDAPTRAAFVFGGWFTSADGGATLAANAFDFATPITGDLTLYAKWTASPTTATVTFDSAGGSPIASQTVGIGQLAIEPMPAPSRNGYALIGWFTSEDGGVTLSDQPFLFKKSPITTDITLYAKWTQAVFSIYTQEGDDEETRTLAYSWTQAELDALISPSTDPVSALYFKDEVWRVWTSAQYVLFDDLFAEAGLTDEWHEGASISYPGNNGSQTYSYKEIVEDSWFFPNTTRTTENIAGAYQVPFVLSMRAYNDLIPQGFTAKIQEAVNVTKQTSDKARTPVFGFSQEWYYGHIGGGQRFWNGITSITFIKAAPPVPVTYAVAFDSTGGSPVDAQVVREGAMAVMPAEPLRDGHAFAGWFTSADGGTTLAADPFDFATPITGDLVLYAKWNVLAPGTLELTLQAHSHMVGWMQPVPLGSVAGTTGKAQSLQALVPALQNATGFAGGVRYEAHVANIGWQGASEIASADGLDAAFVTGPLAGTTGRGLPIEALRLSLTGDLADHYDIYYRVHSANAGWFNWAMNGQEAGTAGLAWQAEAVQVRIVPKGEPVRETDGPVFLTGPYISLPGSVAFDAMAHIEDLGDRAFPGANGTTLIGTSGQSRRVEAVTLMLDNQTGLAGGIEYRTHVQNIGWQDWSADGGFAGTRAQSLRLEAINIRLTGDLASRYDVYYRTHVQNIGWTGWAKNGAPAGSAGYSLRMEAIQVVIVEKGTLAPGAIAPAFYQR
ncbi:MAG: InlB B-repeat-containing protein [Coriobacteriaceae bacterium]|jgi:uncharacterized repeat protein (TIGR02543 family)|nr:InlB B-repeat-containing protein [Coriobacteriaceae bacterium]